MASNLLDRRRSMAPVVPANYSERRIIALETFMLTTHLRGPAALAAFEAQQRELSRRDPEPLVRPDPGGKRLRAFIGRINHEITVMRGHPDYWHWHSVRKGSE